MSNDSIQMCEAVLSLAATYWLHSTVLLSGVWLFLRRRPSASHRLQGRLWKFAATAGLATAVLQSATGTGIPLLNATRTDTTIETSTQSTAARTDHVEEWLSQSLSVEDSLLLVRESLDRLQLPDREIPAETDDGVSALTPASEPIDILALQQQSASSMEPEVIRDAQPALVAEAISAPNGLEATERDFAKSSVESLSWQAVTTVTLAIVCGFGLSWFIGEWLLFLMATRRLQPASWQQLKQLDDLRQRFGIRRRIELLTSEKFSEPVAFGIWQWKIVLPTNLDSRLSKAELDSLLAHEIGHLARGDVLWLHVGRLLTSVLAWQPLNFLARRQWQLQAEFASDDWAISRSVDPVSLARCLTIVAEWRSERRLGAVALPAGGSRSHITDRVERLLAPIGCDIWSSRRRQLFLLGGLAVVSGLLTAAGPIIRHAEAAPTEQSTTARDAAPQATMTGEQPNPAIALRLQLGDEAAQLALEAALLTDELTELDQLLASRPSDSRLQNTIDGLRSRLASLLSLKTTGSSSD